MVLSEAGAKVASRCFCEVMGWAYRPLVVLELVPFGIVFLLVPS